jgi:hypothetical protein
MAQEDRPAVSAKVLEQKPLKGYVEEMLEPMRSEPMKKLLRAVCMPGQVKNKMEKLKEVVTGLIPANFSSGVDDFVVPNAKHYMDHSKVPDVLSALDSFATTKLPAIDDFIPKNYSSAKHPMPTTLLSKKDAITAAKTKFSDELKIKLRGKAGEVLNPFNLVMVREQLSSMQAADLLLDLIEKSEEIKTSQKLGMEVVTGCDQRHFRKDMEIVRRVLNKEKLEEADLEDVRGKLVSWLEVANELVSKVISK